MGDAEDERWALQRMASGRQEAQGEAPMVQMGQLFCWEDAATAGVGAAGEAVEDSARGLPTPNSARMHARMHARASTRTRLHHHHSHPHHPVGAGGR